jgi:very-short-patch-repair endonuclease
VLRAIALEVRGLRVQPQYEVRRPGFYARVDLADELLRLVIEAESWTFHSGRKAFDRDCRRYNALVVGGWRVVRFTWEQVMFDPEYVRSVLQALVDERSGARSTGSMADISVTHA